VRDLFGATALAKLMGGSYHLNTQKDTLAP
jgi:hypothetical protein